MNNYMFLFTKLAKMFWRRRRNEKRVIERNRTIRMRVKSSNGKNPGAWELGSKRHESLWQHHENFYNIHGAFGSVKKFLAESFWQRHESF